ncbi:HPr kinase/phosphatase C-terminal domain-containing protein [Paracoccus sp. Z330]|uniref:HPr kinase/phosphatase C-terminal domain-containing protein n=1 Tax=Paracoccus onchidii TaxID=3017813 RepID=A0ABT4ZBY8_9RHOB|nr:HPr kinase/phosphatase C-terminal domain-containing protein [Paracoccus onchidii]MDB6176878.1 HPr kinase/phosphatase C-terminal domain-containing protein [Paracoccus onchidii]
MDQLHGTTISLNGRGLLIVGPSGAGKSTLALQLMAVGAQLVADDRTDIRRAGNAIIATCPDALQGRIEARGVGILAAEHISSVQLQVVVDLGQQGDERLPPERSLELLGVALPLVIGPYRSHLYAALRQFLLAGRVL